VDNVARVAVAVVIDSRPVKLCCGLGIHGLWFLIVVKLTGQRYEILFGISKQVKKKKKEKKLPFLHSSLFRY
jgi:hypothetical protein